MSKNKLVVYTCITGGYDTLREVKYLSPNVDYICFTDNAALKSKTWKILPLPADLLSEKSVIKRQRFIKILPHKYLSEYDSSLWVDSNIEIIGDLYDFFKKYDLNKKILYVNKHPSRDCIYREQLAVIRLKKDTFENTSEQINRYRDEGFPEHYGLAETNILLRKHNDKRCVSLMEAWANEIRQGSHRDQLSFNYCVWKCNLQSVIEYLDEKYYNLHISDNAFFFLRKHMSVSGMKEFQYGKTIDTNAPQKIEEKVEEKQKDKIEQENKPIALPKKKSKDSVSVVIFTHNRTNVAKETIKSLFKNLKYSGDINWVLSDDRSDKKHIAELTDLFNLNRVAFDLVQTTSTRFGLGASMNIGLQKAFEYSDVVLRVEDDWLLQKKLDLDRFVKTLRENKTVCGIRIGMVGGGVNRNNTFNDKNYVVLTGPSDKSWLFVNQVAIVHKRIHDSLGWYEENVSADKSEEEFRTRFNKATNNGSRTWTLLVPAEMKWRTFDDPSLWFIHVGRSTLGHTIYKEPKRYSWIYSKKNYLQKEDVVVKNSISWPRISVMMTTHNRTSVAQTVIDSLCSKLKYNGKITWIITDDRSEIGHTKALLKKFRDNKINDIVLCTTDRYRWGLGASMNNGLKEAFKVGDIVLTTEDDWLLMKEFDISPFVKLLLENEIAGIRLGAMDPNCILLESKWSGFKKVTGKDDGKKYWPFNNQVMLRHKRIFDKIGYMKENCSPQEQELCMAKQYDKLTNFGQNEEFCVLWPSNYDVGTLFGKNNPFHHIGKSTMSKFRYVPAAYKNINDEDQDKKIRTSALYDFPVDYVLPYCDTTEASWRTEYEKFKKENDWDKQENQKRFETNDILFKYIFKGIEKFAPWINKIFLLVNSESQVPAWIDRNRITIVTHDKFIPKEYLPTFNSCTIEMFLHRIPGLSEHFIYGNDDMYLLNNVEKSDFFTLDGNPKNTMLFFRRKELIRYHKMLARQTKDITNDLGIEYHNNTYYAPFHVQNAMLKSFNAWLYERFRDKIEGSITKFRNEKNFCQYLFVIYYYLMTNGKYSSSASKIAFDIQNEFRSIILALSKKEWPKLCCFNNNFKKHDQIIEKILKTKIK